jgi:hypothetical protein
MGNTFQSELAEKVQAGIEMLAAQGIVSGDVVNGLQEVKTTLESTLAIYCYLPPDVIGAADDCGLSISQEQADTFLVKVQAERGDVYQSAGYSAIRSCLESELRRVFE